MLLNELDDVRLAYFAVTCGGNDGRSYSRVCAHERVSDDDNADSRRRVSAYSGASVKSAREIETYGYTETYRKCALCLLSLMIYEARRQRVSVMVLNTENDG